MFIMEPKHLQVGKRGEVFASKYLEKQGFKVCSRNYWKPYGEIDIVASKNGTIYFIEVKTVTRQVIRETSDGYEPEDNVHSWKRQRLGRVIQVYLQEKGIEEDCDWQVDVLMVYLDPEGRLLKIDSLDDIILD